MRCRESGGTLAFVPTMGALHAGHMSLVEAAGRMADRVVVSIFVNPTQFGPNEDYQRYPRPLDDDLELCRKAGVTGAFVPSTDTIYPPQMPGCSVDVPELTEILEGEMRPTHFAGVCRVVLKLLNIVCPTVAVFGRKDYQQWRVVDSMVQDLMLPVRVVAMPTLREQDGLAMSSRNAYLDAEARGRAVGLFKALSEARHLIEVDGETDPGAVERTMQTILRAHHIDPQYAVVRHPSTLRPIDCIEPELTGGVVALIAGVLDNIRLIDNMLLAVPDCGDASGSETPSQPSPTPDKIQ